MTPLRHFFWNWISIAIIGLTALHFAISDVSAQTIAAAPTAAPAQGAAPPQGQPGQSAAPLGDYKLGTGDKLRVIVFGEADLGGEYVVDSGGFIRLPLIGQIHAAGDTVRQFENEVISKLKDGYLKDPRVSAEVLNYRPFYIIGEINKPGEYAYVNGMSVLNAVALAGGYTFRADQRRVYIRRDGTGKEETLNADQTTKVNPGDIIRVAERFF